MMSPSLGHSPRPPEIPPCMPWDLTHGLIFKNTRVGRHVVSDHFFLHRVFPFCGLDTDPEPRGEVPTPLDMAIPSSSIFLHQGHLVLFHTFYVQYSVLSTLALTWLPLPLQKSVEADQPYIIVLEPRGTHRDRAVPNTGRVSWERGDGWEAC